MSLSTFEQKASASDTVTAGAFAFDEVGATHYAISKVVYGALGTITYVTASAGLPVAQQGTWTVELGATDNAVLDAIAASVAAGSTAAKQDTAAAILTTIDTDTGAIATSAASIDTKTPALGQALAAASVPVVLTAAQISTLTPPAAITGFATESTLGTLSAKFASGTVIGDVNLGATDNAVLDAIAASLAGTLTVGSHAVTNAGTFAVQAAQSGTWNVTNISGTVSLPTGAATAAKQPALGTAGTASSDVITVQGIASMTALKVDGSAVTQPVSGTFWQATQPVSGTVTAELSATDNAVLDAIAASVAGTLTVGSHAVTNAGTFATQATLQAGTAYAGKLRLTDGTTDAEVVPLAGYNAQAVAIVDGDGNQLTSFGGGTQYTEDAAAAANPVGNAQILVRADTPAGVVTTDGDNVAQRGSNYGAAYVTLVDNAGSFVSVGGGTQYDEDTAHVSGDKVTMAGVVRADTAAALSATDGDRTCLITDASGRLHVNVGNTVTVGSHAVTNAGTFAVQVDGAALTALQLIDDAIVTDGGAAGKYIALAAYDEADTGLMQRLNMDNVTGALMVNIAGSSNTIGVEGTFTHDAATNFGTSTIFANGGRASAAAPTDVSADNDAVVSWFLRNGSQVCNLAVGGTLVTGSAGLPVAQQGTFTVDLGATDNAVLDAIAASLVTVDSNTDSGAVVGNGAAATAQRVTIANDSTGIVGLAAGTNAIGKLTSNTGVTIGAVEIAAAQTLATVTTCTTVTTLTGGGVAHDSADSGNPVKVGARAAATLSDDTMVANADRTDAVSDLDGAIIIRSGFPLGDLISEQVTNTNGTSTAFTNFGATASTRSYITAITVYNSSATAGTVDFRDGTAGTVLWTMPIPATGGSVISNGGVPLFCTTANTALAYDVSGALSTVTISISGFKSKARA